MAQVISGDISQHPSIQCLAKAILDLRQIYRRDLIRYALREVSAVLVLLPYHQSPKWELLDILNMPEKAFETLMWLQSGTNFGNHNLLYRVYDAGLWHVQNACSKRQQPRSTLPMLGLDTQTGDCMLAIRSPTWPEDCPRFCLFILPASIDDTECTLSKLLETTISLKNFLAVGDYHWSQSD
jgi:hypothetical protein